MTSDQIKAFLAAAESGSFSKAADKVYMSQSTFGRNISGLEQELGFSLFVRVNRSNRLTAGGEIMYEGLKKLTDEYETLVDEALQLQTGRKGSLKLGILEGQMIDEKISDMIRDFRQQYPNIRVHLTRYSFRAMLDALRSSELDIAFTLTADVVQKQEFSCFEIYDLKNELIVARDHPLAGKQDLTLADFRDEVFVDIKPEESAGISELLVNSCRRAGFEPQIRYAENLQEQVFCVETRQGITAFNEYHQVYHHPALCHISLSEFPPVSFCAAWLKESANPAVMLFIETISSRK